MGRHKLNPKRDELYIVPPQEESGDDDVPEGVVVVLVIVIGLGVIAGLSVLCAIYAGLF